MRFASPFTDILYFLFLCTDSVFRSTYFDELMTDYYDSLKSMLNVYNIDINSVYAKENFDNDCKDLLPFGLLVALVELRIVTNISDDEVISNESEIVPGIKDVPGESAYLKIRVNDVVKESVENGVLDRLIDKVNSL